MQYYGDRSLKLFKLAADAEHRGYGKQGENKLTIANKKLEI